MRRRLVRRLVLALAAVALCDAPPDAAAQTPPLLRDFMHEKWNTDDGLTTPAVQSVLRTRDGYLWVGASRGLLRFDGQRFRGLDSEASTDGRLETASITSLAEDRTGAVWVGTEQFGVARVRGSRIDWYSVAEGLPAARVHRVFIDRGGHVWVGTNSGLASFEQQIFVPVAGSSASINAIAEDADSRIWTATTLGLWVLEHRTLVRHRAADGGIDGVVSALFRDRDNRLWVGAASGLYMAMPGTRTLRPSPAFGPRWVSALAEDRDGRLWAGTSGDGLYLVNPGRPPRRLGVDGGLSQDSIATLFADHEGSLWIGTPDGLDRVRARTLRTLGAGGPSRLSWSVAVDDPNGAWVGSNRGVVRVHHDGSIAAVPGLSTGTVRDLLQTRDGTLWAGVDDIFYRVPRGGRPQQVAPPGHHVWGRVRAIHEARDGTLWIGSTLAGLARRDPGATTFVSASYPEDRDPSRLWTIAEDERGAIWVGGHGAHVFADGRWRSYSRQTGLPSDDVMAILPEPGRVWIGAYDEGLTLVQDDRVTVFRRLEPAIHPQAYSILDDGRGYLWVSSSLGLQRLSKQSLLDAATRGRGPIDVMRFDKLDGLLSPEFNGAGAHAGVRTASGQLWFASSSGAVLVDPAHIGSPPRLAPVRIEAVVADDTPAPVLGDVLLPRGRGRQRLEFQFSSPSLLTPRRVRFRYRLEGFDHDWVDSGTRRSATYTGLAGGRYRFHAQAYYAGASPDSGPETAVAVVMPRYVTETTVFAVSLPLALIAAGYGFHLLRVRRLRNQADALTRVVDERTQALRVAQVDLERRVQERTAQLESELGERKRLEGQLVQAQKLDSIGRLAGGIAHDLNNLLTAILGYASLAEQASGDNMREDVRQITAAGERAARLTQQLLAFARRQVTEPRHLNPNAVIRDLEPMLRRLIGEDIELTCTLTPEPWTIRADANQVQQVLVNLVINARDAMPEGGRLAIATTGERQAGGDVVVIAVTDNGVGITDDVKAHLFEPFFTTKPAGKGTGLGLATSYGIVAQAGGQIEIDSVVGRGTTVRVSLPRVDAPPDVVDDGPRDEPPTATDARTVLLTEDEVLVRAMASRVLRDLGHHVLEAVDGEDALEVAARHAGPIDLLVTDLVMPRLGGLDLASRLRARQPGLRVVFMSGYADRAVAAQLPSGVPMLHKPFTPAVLAQRVQDVISAADVVHL